MHEAFCAVLCLRAGDNESAAAIPASFSAGVQSWTRSKMISKGDDELFAEFLMLHPEDSDSPQLEGAPIIFSSGTSDLRYYWL